MLLNKIGKIPFLMELPFWFSHKATLPLICLIEARNIRIFHSVNYADSHVSKQAGLFLEKEALIESSKCLFNLSLSSCHLQK